MRVAGTKPLTSRVIEPVQFDIHFLLLRLGEIQLNRSFGGLKTMEGFDAQAYRRNRHLCTFRDGIPETLALNAFGKKNEFSRIEVGRSYKSWKDLAAFGILQIDGEMTNRARGLSGCLSLSGKSSSGRASRLGRLVKGMFVPLHQDDK